MGQCWGRNAKEGIENIDDTNIAYTSVPDNKDAAQWCVRGRRFDELSTISFIAFFERNLVDGELLVDQPPICGNSTRNWILPEEHIECTN